MRVRLHEPDPMEVQVDDSGNEGLPLEVRPVFYGRSRSCVLFPISTTTEGGKPLHSYRLKVTDTGKLVLEELGQPRVLEVDRTEPTTHKLR